MPGCAVGVARQTRGGCWLAPLLSAALHDVLRVVWFGTSVVPTTVRIMRFAGGRPLQHIYMVLLLSCVSCHVWLVGAEKVVTTAIASQHHGDMDGTVRGTV